ncbi:hypothetical protein PYCCODRAFT_819893 [Trametes coccinea BRFM310]|uniref:F-box domain-containing protein n=1 Tax=Trametes coccinea (strain BRFM310) TaxID=1353009 RepID=A0A1Y2IG57_TRAC3|nr:hypothetical protein PYCCODRAFT_819893 [Trametes coccinea BRFM310]
MTAWIDRLPAETLLEIFAYVRNFAKSFVDYEPWYRLLWVCRRWRTLVTETSELWTDIDINKHMKRNLVEACLTFSKQARLDIGMSGTTTTQNAWIVERLLPHVNRIRRLQVHSMDETADDALKTLLGKTMPALTELKVSFTTKTRLKGPYELPEFLGPVHDELEEPFLWDLTPERYPALRELCLGSALEIDGPLPVFRRLRKLELHGCLSAPMTITEFAHYLSHLPALEELSLKHYRPEIPVAPATPVTSEPFLLPPTLRKLILKDNYYYTIPFLSSFDLPFSMSIKVIRALDIVDYGDMTTEMLMEGYSMSVLHALPPKWFLWPILDDVTSIELRHFLSSCFMLVGTTPDGRAVELVGEVPPEWPREESEDSPHRLNNFRDLIDAFDQSPVEELFVNGHDAQEIDQDAWEDAFAAFPKLKRIQVDHTDSLTEFDTRLSLIEALLPQKRKRREAYREPQATVPVPQLESLVFTSSAFDREDGEFSSTLAHCLTLRKERGCPLKHLRLYLEYTARAENEEAEAPANMKRVETYQKALGETVERLELEVINNFYDTRSSRLWYYEGNL